jgi:TolB-like protein
VAEADRLAKGISDATVARLADADHVARLKVIGNASELRFSFRPPDLKQMGEALGADFVVLGQLRRDDRSYRLLAHLIRVSDQTHLWANAYDRGAMSLADQSNLADAIAGEVTRRVAR